MGKEKKEKRFDIYSKVASHMKMDAGNFTKLVKSGRIKGQALQVYVKDEIGVFYPVGESTIKVVDIQALPQEV
jgi:hypothetical protein